VSRIKEDPRCTSLLGDRKTIKAYGEATWNRWARNRPIAYVEFDSPELERSLANIEKNNGTKRLRRERTYAHKFQCEPQFEICYRREQNLTAGLGRRFFESRCGARAYD
jgi:hypothetical protein